MRLITFSISFIKLWTSGKSGWTCSGLSLRYGRLSSLFFIIFSCTSITSFFSGLISPQQNRSRSFLSGRGCRSGLHLLPRKYIPEMREPLFPAYDTGVRRHLKLLKQQYLSALRQRKPLLKPFHRRQTNFGNLPEEKGHSACGSSTSLMNCTKRFWVYSRPPS